MGVARVMINDAPSSPLPGVTSALNFYQVESTCEKSLQASNDLHHVVVGEVDVRLVQQVEDCPQINRLRTEINLDVHRVIDPDFILHEKKEIF